VPGILALTVLSTSVRSGVAMVTDVNTGMLDKFLISPINRSSILLGRVFADAITMAVQCLTVVAIAYVMGLRSQTGPGGVLALLVITLWLGICAASFSNFIALRTRNPQITMMVGINSTLPLMFLSPAFFPMQLQPGWLQAAAKVNPVAYAVTAGQDLLNKGFDGGRLLATAGVLGLTAFICVTGATRAFQRATSGAAGRAPKARSAPKNRPPAAPARREQPALTP
jgi:ABC-2 type transport system permease protein